MLSGLVWLVARVLLTSAADPMDDAVRATLDDAVSAFGADYDMDKDAGLAGGGSAARSIGDNGEADNTVSLSAPAAEMRRTLDDVLTVGDDVEADLTASDKLTSSSLDPPGTRPMGRHSPKHIGSEDQHALRSTNGAPRRKVALDPPAPGAVLDAEFEELWLRATASFEDGEYSEALPGWQELAAGAFESSNGASDDAPNLPIQIPAAFNLASTHEQLGAYHEAMAVYDWICQLEPVSCSETIQRTYDLIAYIATTFPHRQEASDQLDALLAKDSKGERAQRVRQNRKWHGKTAQKQAGKSHGSVGHGGALALWGIPGFQESSVKEDFAQVWHEAAHLAIDKKHFEAFNLWAVLAQILDYGNAEATEAYYNWGTALASFGHLHEALNLMNKASTAAVIQAAEAAARLRDGMAAECARHPDYSDENPEGILCDTRWSYAWAHPQIIGPSDFNRQGQRHVGWKLVPPGDPPSDIVGLSSLLNLPGSTSDGQSGDAGSSMLYGIAIGSVGMFLVLHLSGVIGGGGRGKRGKAGRGMKRGRMSKLE